MSCTILALYSAKCDQCGQRPESPYPDLERARQWSIEHDAKHIVWSTNARYIDKSDVFDPKAHERYLGRIRDAEKIAREQGKRYILWNGAVYRVGAVDFLNPFCYGEDVGLTW